MNLDFRMPNKTFLKDNMTLIMAMAMITIIL